MYNNKYVSLADDNLLNSMSDKVERLWLGVKLGYLGSIYFPGDNMVGGKEEVGWCYEKTNDSRTLQMIWEKRLQKTNL